MEEEQESSTDFPVWHFRAAEDTKAGNYSNSILKLFLLPHLYSSMTSSHSNILQWYSF